MTRVGSVPDWAGVWVEEALETGFIDEWVEEEDLCLFTRAPLLCRVYVALVPVQRGWGYRFFFVCVA